MASKVERRGVYLYIDGKQVEKSATTIKREMDDIIRKQRDMVIGSKEYVEAQKKIESLRSVLAAHRKGLAETEKQTVSFSTKMGKMADSFNRFFGMIGAGIAALTGITLAIRSMRDELNKMEDAQANLKALTGLDDRSIGWLTSQAKTLATTMDESGLRVRKSVSEILDAYMLVGSAKPELLKDKEGLNAVTVEAMRLAEASKMELKDAVEGVTLALNMYGASTDQAARFTNVLAAGSKEGAANVESQTRTIQKSGVAASMANVSIEELVGSIQTLAEKGIKDEIAGTGLKKFFLRLQTGADETNPKVVGLSTALDNLVKKNMSAAQLEKMFGEEGFNVAAVMISNAEAVKKYTEAVTDTNIAVEQAAINSDTASAKLEQSRNKLKLAAAELAERFNPAITVSTNLLTWMVKILPGVIDGFQKFAPIIISSAAAVALYVASLKAQELWSKRVIIAETAKNIVLAIQDKYIKACEIRQRLLTGAITLSTAAQQLFNIVLGMNPLGVLLGALSLAVGALLMYRNSLKAAMDAQTELTNVESEAESQNRSQINELNSLRKMVNDNTLSIDQRRYALKELQKIVPAYNASLSDEGKLINNNTSALDDYIRKLTVSTKLKVASERLSNIQGDLAELKNPKRVDRMNQLFPNIMRWMGLDPATKEKNMSEAISIYQTMVDDLTKEMADIATKTPPVTPELDNDPGGNEDSKAEERLKKALKKIETDASAKRILAKTQYAIGESDYLEYTKKLREIEAESLAEQLKLYKEGTAEYNAIREKQMDSDLESLKESKEMKLRELETTYRSEQLQTAQFYADGEISKAAYEEEKFQNEIDYMNRKLGLLEPFSEEYLKLEAEIEDKATAQKIAKREERERRIAEFEAKYLKKDPKEQLDDEMTTLDEAYLFDLISEEEYQKARVELQKKADEDMLKSAEEKIKEKAQAWSAAISTLQVGLSAVSEFIQAEQEAEIAAVNKKYESEIAAAGDNQGKITAIEKKKEAEIARVKSQYADKAATMQIAQAVASTAQAAINAYASALSVPIIGLTLAPIAAGMAIAAGMLQIATIRKQAQAQKMGYYKGGFTPDGDPFEEQGVVHSGEMVVNRFGVRNPAVRPMLNIIDEAQRTGTISNLTSEDLARALPPMYLPDRQSPVYSSPEASRSARNSTADQRDSIDRQTIDRLTETMDRLDERFSKPQFSYTTITGPGGSEEAAKLYDQMKRNKSR